MYRTPEEESILELLVKDSLIMRMTPTETKNYIDARMNKKVGIHTIYALKKRLKEKMISDVRLINHTAKDGYIDEHFDCVDNVNTALAAVQKALTYELHSVRRDTAKVARLGLSVNELAKTKAFLNLGGPVIARLKVLLTNAERNGAIERTVDIEPAADRGVITSNGNGSKRSLPSTSLFIQSGSESDEDSRDGTDDSGISTGEGTSERIF